jgi:hypothetical protein
LYPLWVCLPHLPLHCWGDDVLKSIGDVIGKYIDKEEPKPPMFACARICVKVDLEKGIPKSIKLTLDNWSLFNKLITSNSHSSVGHVMNMAIFPKIVPRNPRKFRRL